MRRGCFTIIVLNVFTKTKHLEKTLLKKVTVTGCDIRTEDKTAQNTEHTYPRHIRKVAGEK